MTRHLIYLFILFLLAYGCGDAAGDETGKWTEEQEAVATQNCVSSGNPDDYCKCSVSILVTIFSYDEFIGFDRKIRSGQQPSGAVASKMMQMSKRVIQECRSDLTTE